MTSENILLMTENFRVDNIWFLYNHKYEYTGSVMKEVDCEGCDQRYLYKQQLHYIVVINGGTYYIPSYACVVGLTEDQLPEDDEQNTQKWIADDMVKDALTDDDGKTDYVEGAKMLGKDIAAKERMDQSDHNGDYMLRKIQERYPNE